MLICFVIVTFYFISLVFQKLEGPGSQQTGAGLGGGPGVPGQEHAGSGIPVPYGIPPAPAGRSQQLKVGDPSKQLGKEGKGTHLHETTNKQTSNHQKTKKKLFLLSPGQPSVYQQQQRGFMPHPAPPHLLLPPQTLPPQAGMPPQPQPQVPNQALFSAQQQGPLSQGPPPLSQGHRPLLLGEQPLLLQDLLDQERHEQQQQRQKRGTRNALISGGWSSLARLHAC